jgi:hypothetical protein
MFIDAIVTLTLIIAPLYLFFRWVQADSERQDKPTSNGSASFR